MFYPEEPAQTAHFFPRTMLCPCAVQDTRVSPEKMQLIMHNFDHRGLVTYLVWQKQGLCAAQYDVMCLYAPTDFSHRKRPPAADPCLGLRWLQIYLVEGVRVYRLILAAWRPAPHRSGALCPRTSCMSLGRTIHKCPETPCRTEGLDRLENVGVQCVCFLEHRSVH